MTWNYRIVQTDTTDGPLWGLYEVYYDDDDQPIMRSVDPVTFVDEDDPVGIIDALQHALATLIEYPVLDDSVFDTEE